VLASAIATTSILDLKKAVFAKEIDEQRTIKFVYQGKMLDDKSLLSQYTFPTNPFIHVIVSQSLATLPPNLP
jgi:hypothetical protein